MLKPARVNIRLTERSILVDTLYNLIFIAVLRVLDSAYSNLVPTYLSCRHEPDIKETQNDGMMNGRTKIEGYELKYWHKQCLWSPSISSLNLMIDRQTDPA